MSGFEFIHPVQVAKVEVDPDTGQVEVVAFISVHDIGKAINPDGVLGHELSVAAETLKRAKGTVYVDQEGKIYG